MTSEKKWKKLCWDLYYESKTGNAEEAEALIQKGACVNNQEVDTPLHIAANKSVVDALIKAGANINVQDSKGANIEEEEDEEECGPECNGIVGIEQEEPTDRDLGRFARRLNIHVYLLGKVLAIPDVDITTITENPRYGETEKKLRVLQEWRARMSRRENPTWQKLKDNLELIDRNAKHKVCKIRGPVQINEFLTARNMQFDTPSTQQLHSLGDRIDPFKCFDLGIELGLTRSKIDQIRINHPDNVAQQIRKILSVWQNNESEIKPKGDKQFTLPTFLVLSNALDEVKIYNSVLKETIEDND